MKDYKEKYLKYRNKYLNLKNTKIKQTGGTIQDVFQYLEENMGKIDPNHFDIIQLHAYSYMDDMPYVTLEAFIVDVKELYDINLPRPRSPPRGRSPPRARSPQRGRSPQRARSPPRGRSPPRAMALAAVRKMDSPQALAAEAAMDRLSLYVPASAIASAITSASASACAMREPMDGSLITVYTTGLSYFEKVQNKVEYVKALIDNIVDTCYRAGKRVKFIHYDFFDDLSPRYYRDEIFINGYLTIDIIQEMIKNNRNALLVDCAHIIRYFRNPKPFIMKPIIKHNDLIIKNINCFYPGFLGNMDNTDYVRNFKFFQFDNDNNIITFIEKGIEKSIKIRELYMGSYETFLDFTGEQDISAAIKINNEIEIYGRVANVRTSHELNRLFWD